MKDILFTLVLVLLSAAPAGAADCVYWQRLGAPSPEAYDLEGECDSLARVDPWEWRNYRKQDCKNLTSVPLRDPCLFVVALNRREPELCYGIEFHDPFLSDDGWKVAVRDEAYCSYAVWSEYERDRLKTPSADFCRRLSRTVEETRDQCLARAARHDRNPRICFESGSPAAVSRCLGDDQKLETDAWRLESTMDCEELTTHVVDQWKHVWRDRCMTMLARQRGDAGVCQEIAELPWGAQAGWWDGWFQCLQSVASDRKDPEICRAVAQYDPPSHYPQHIFSVEGCRTKVLTGDYPEPEIVR